MKTQHLEISRADSKCGQLHWVAACARKLHIGMCVYRKILEGAVSCSKIQKIPWIHGELRILGAAVENSRNSFGLRIRQGLQQNPVDHAKNCAVGPNAQRQRQNNDHCECWTPAEHAHRVPYVLQKVVDVLCLAHIPALLLDLAYSP